MRSRITLTTFASLLVAAVLPALCAAQSTYPQRRATLAYAWDLDGEAADPDQIVTAANGDLTDTKTFTITAQPDVCRLIDITQTDANSSITAGLLTITGTDCLGYARVCSLDYSVAANRGSGVKSPSVTTGPSGSSCYLAAVTTITTNALTGEGGAGVDLATIGYTSNSATGWPLYGTLLPVGASSEHGVDPLGSTTETRRITTSGAASATVTAVDHGAFTSVSVGDMLRVAGYERQVTAKANINSITVHAPLALGAEGVPFAYQTRFFSTDPTDLMALPITGYRTLFYTWGVTANANTGGVSMYLECTDKGAGWPTATWITLCPSTGCVSGATASVASGAAQAGMAESINLEALPFTHCRQGFKFGTGDDADVAAEVINAAFTLRP
jgi:hypothetical protein